MSAGNDGGANPEYPAQYAADPRYAGSVVAVGATTTSGALASFSNKAGVAAAGYIAAPGQGVVVSCSQGNSCYVVSGTSFSAPQVAGAIALLLQAFPNISGRDAISILFATADDAGAPGVDSVYGNGILDLSRAFQPVGTMSVQTAGGAQVALATSPGSTLGSAFGPRLARDGALVTVGRDRYQRLFAVDLGQSWRAGPAQALVAQAPPTRATSQTVALSGGARLSIAGEQPLTGEIDENRAAAGFFAVDPASATLALDAPLAGGSLGLLAWKGRGAVAPPSLGGPRDAFQDVAQPDRLLAANWRRGRLSVGVEEGWAQRPEPYSAQPQAASSYVRASLGYQAANGGSARLAVGTLDEPLGPLGSNLAPGSSFGMPARTSYLSLQAEGPVGPLWGYAQASVGRSRFQSRLLGADQAISSAWRVGVVGDCSALAKLCATWGAELSQPLRVEAGDASATLEAVPVNYDDAPIFTTRRFSLSPSGREVILTLFADRSLGRWGRARLSLSTAGDEAHVAGAPLGVGVGASWRFGF